MPCTGCVQQGADGAGVASWCRKLVVFAFRRGESTCHLRARRALEGWPWGRGRPQWDAKMLVGGSMTLTTRLD